VLGDLAEAAAFMQSPRRCVGFTSHDLYGRCKPVDDTISKYYLRLGVEDRPGVLAQIAGTLAKADIGILSVIQPEGLVDGSVPLILTLHDAPYGSMKKTANELASLPCVKGTPLLLHMEAFS
jgi:homoserine dehydrogenase